MTKGKKAQEAQTEENKSKKSFSEQKEPIQESSAATPPPKNLYEKEMERYRVFLQYGFDVAYKYYGFSLFHSLSPDEKVEIAHKLGFEPRNPEDYYNLGCLFAQKKDYASACKYFKKTIEMAADFEEAYYNLAVTLENLGQEKEAISNWEIYCEFLDEDSSESLLVSQRIEELKTAQTSSKKKDSK